MTSPYEVEALIDLYDTWSKYPSLSVNPAPFTAMEFANLQNKLVQGKSLRNLRMSHSKLCGAVFFDCKIMGVDLSKTDCLNAIFRNSSLRGASFEDALCRSTSFEKCNLSGTNFRNSDLCGAHFKDSSDIYLADFSGAKAERSLFRGNCEKLIGSGANFEGADFSRSFLRQANFWKASLRNVNFSYADVSSVSFEGADLRGAYFQNANVSCANFKGANLGGVRLWEAGGFWTAEFQGGEKHPFLEKLLFLQEYKSQFFIPKFLESTIGGRTVSELLLDLENLPLVSSMLDRILIEMRKKRDWA